jgi:hypothetical protein
MKRSFLLFLALLLAACTAPGETPRGYTPAPTERPTPTATPQPTPTPTATETPTPIPVEFSAELPSSVAGCPVWPDDPEAYKIWVAQRNASEKAALAANTEEGSWSDFSRIGEDYDENLPYNTVEIWFGSEHLIGCSRSADGKQVGLDIAVDSEHILHLIMVPSATEAYEAANNTDFELQGAKSDLDGMLEAISQGRNLNIAVRLFENMSSRLIERSGVMDKWKWVNTILDTPLDKLLPLDLAKKMKATNMFNTVGDLSAGLVIGFSSNKPGTQIIILEAVGEVNLPVAELGWGG